MTGKAPEGERAFWLAMNLVLHGDVTDSMLLYSWFGRWEPTIISSTLPMTNIGEGITTRYDLTILPDLCGRCHTTFGTTLGGKLRMECPCCRHWDEGYEWWQCITLKANVLRDLIGCGDSPIIHYISHVFPTRVYDGPINKDISYDPRYHGAG